MPIFLNQTRGYENSEIANILTVYEVATLLGTVTLGPLTDLTYGKRSPISMVAILVASITAFFLTYKFEFMTKTGFCIGMAMLGFSLGSVYHLISITCCADLGKEQRGKRATATISGIVDGCGNSGAGTGMFCLGIFIEKFGYQYGFMFIVSVMITMTLVPLTIILLKDLKEIRK